MQSPSPGPKSPVLSEYKQRLHDTFEVPIDTLPPIADEEGERQRGAFLVERALRAYAPAALQVAVDVAEEHGLDCTQLRAAAVALSETPDRTTLGAAYDALRVLRALAPKDIVSIGTALRSVELTHEMVTGKRTGAGAVGVVVYYAAETMREAEQDCQPLVDVVLADLRAAARIGGAPC